MNILITGGNGFLGSDLAVLAKKVYKNSTVLTPSKEELNLLDYERVYTYISSNKIDKVFHCAGRVSGMFGHEPGLDLYDNCVMGLNIAHACLDTNIDTLVNIGSTCIYPKAIIGNVPESSLLTGAFEPSCEGMALGKSTVVRYIESIRGDKNYMTVMPPNIYGPGEPIRENGNHCLLDILIKFHKANEEGLSSITLPGTGSAIRSFMHVQDCSLAILWCEKNNKYPIVNIGSGVNLSIQRLVAVIKDVVNYSGEVKFTGNVDEDGHPDKTEDLTLVKMNGYQPKNCIDIYSGIKQLYNYYLVNEI